MSEQATNQTQEVKDHRFHNTMEEVLALIKARVPIIWVVTHEEGRFIDDFVNTVAEPNARQVWLWSIYQGLIRQNQYMDSQGMRATGEESETFQPPIALEHIVKMKPQNNDVKGIVYVMRDFYMALTEPITRQIRDMYEHLINTGKTLIITGPVLAHGGGGAIQGLPPNLEKQITVVNYELPRPDQIEVRVREAIQHMKKSDRSQKHKDTRLTYNDMEVQECTRALTGLTMIEVDDAISTSVTHMQELNVQRLIAAKRQIIKKNQILEFIDQPVGMEDVGGMDHAKEYLNRYSRQWTDEAKDFGVEPLKGMLLTGIPGTGKSLLAKAIMSAWKLPGLRIDVGKVMTGLVGGSEEKMRQVIGQLEAMAPCIGWIDEVEKALSGTKSSNFSDGGTLSRVFGTLLTAMEEGLKGVTIVATANDINALPPEFIRRFNEVFFVDLPGPDERWDILAIHLRKRGRDIKSFEKDKSKLLTATDGFTGAEIEKAVKDAIAAAFHANQKDLETTNVLKTLAETKPISKVMGAKISKLRDKAKGSYTYASSWAEEQAGKHEIKTSKGKKLDLDDALDNMDEIATTSKKRHEKAKKKLGNRFEEISKEN